MKDLNGKKNRVLILFSSKIQPYVLAGCEENLTHLINIAEMGYHTIKLKHEKDLKVNFLVLNI